MTDHIKIHATNSTWVVRAAGAVIAESKNALELVEGDYPSVIYFPKSDIAMAFLDTSENRSTCPHKGTASYFDIVTKSGTLENTAWSYETPHKAVAAIAGHIAFFADRVTVEEL